MSFLTLTTGFQFKYKLKHSTQMFGRVWKIFTKGWILCYIYYFIYSHQLVLFLFIDNFENYKCFLEFQNGVHVANVDQAFLSPVKIIQLLSFFYFFFPRMAYLGLLLQSLGLDVSPVFPHTPQTCLLSCSGALLICFFFLKTLNVLKT